MSVFTIKRNDTLPLFKVRLFYPDGSEVDFQAGDTARFLMRRAGKGKELVVDRGPMSVELDSGVAQFRFSASDTEAYGVFNAEVEVTFASGDIMTWPNEGYYGVKITEDLDAA